MVNRISPPAIPLTGRDDIGGAIVRRTFSSGGDTFFNGKILTAAQVRAFKESNFRALRDNGYIQVFPQPRSGDPSIPPSHIRVEPVTGKRRAPSSAPPSHGAALEVSTL